MVIKNFYKILGVNYSADEAEIRSVYRALAKKYHPDLNQGDAAAAAKFRNINEAGEALLDHEKRREHDVLLESKGIDTGLRAKLLKEEAEKVAKEEAEAAEKAEKAEKAEEAKRNAEKIKSDRAKKPMTRAEKAAAAMAKVKESKRLTRRALVMSLSIVAGVIVIAVSVALGVLFGGKKYNLTLNYQNGLSPKVIEYKEGSRVSAPQAPQDYDNFTFNGWFTDPGTGGEEVTFPFEIKKNLTIYARWDTRVYFEINLDYNGATGNNGLNSVNVEKNKYDWDGIVPVPTRTGYIWKGWYKNDTDEEVITPGKTGNTNVAWTDDIEFLTARWIPRKISVEFNWKNGGKFRDSVDYDTPADTALAEGYKSGPYGWYSAEFIGFFDGDTPVTDSDGKLLEIFKYLNGVTLIARYDSGG
jgi:uncharacterized repeat protein (TIGR02543 family)